MHTPSGPVQPPDVFHEAPLDIKDHSATVRTCPVCKASRPIGDFRRTCCKYCHNPKATLEERFWAKVRKDGTWGCWEWQAQRNDNGYGLFRLAPNASPKRASRMAWTLTFGDPGALFVLHHCDNPPCCNPRHLFLGTSADNSLDCRRKGRWQRSATGPTNLTSAFWLARRKLTDEQIAEARLRRADGETYRSIGRKLGVHHTTILRLVDGTHWKDGTA